MMLMSPRRERLNVTRTADSKPAASVAWDSIPSISSGDAELPKNSKTAWDGIHSYGDSDRRLIPVVLKAIKHRLVIALTDLRADLVTFVRRDVDHLQRQ